MESRPHSHTKVEVKVVENDDVRPRSDRLATEEPMEIRIANGSDEQTLAITMRTPGADFELAAGFLYGEAVVAHNEEIERISYCVDPQIDEEQRFNIVTIGLNKPLPDLPGLHRHFYTSSACGVCGKASLDSLELRGCKPVSDGPDVERTTIHELPEKLRAAQGIFDKTGGLHAAGLFDPAGELVVAREDVGRHNAVDKVIGRVLLDGGLPLEDSLLMVSGRASYEILQKALAARIPMVCSVSAPSSLAVDVARRFEMTLIGFVRDRRFNIYAGAERVRGI